MFREVILLGAKLEDYMMVCPSSQHTAISSLIERLVLQKCSLAISRNEY